MSDTIYADDRDEDTPDLTGLEDGGRDEDDLMAEEDKMMDIHLMRWGGLIMSNCNWSCPICYTTVDVEEEEYNREDDYED
jgi:hypothetical protein